MRRSLPAYCITALILLCSTTLVSGQVLRKVTFGWGDTARLVKYLERASLLSSNPALAAALKELKRTLPAGPNRDSSTQP